MEAKKLCYCVNNTWKESVSGAYSPVMNPSTGEHIADAPICTREEVEAAVAAARAAYPGWSAQPVAVRTQILFRFRELVNEHFEELSVLLATEMGKNLSESRGDVFKVIEACELAVGAPLELQGFAMMEATSGHDTHLYRESVGVFLGIAPYNFPAMIPFGWFIPPCIVAGNCMVLKAATLVSQTGMRLLELLIEAGLPEGVVTLVTCSREELGGLIGHANIDGVSFVGSESVSKKIYGQAAQAGKRVQALTEAKIMPWCLRTRHSNGRPGHQRLAQGVCGRMDRQRARAGRGNGAGRTQLRARRFGKRLFRGADHSG